MYKRQPLFPDTAKGCPSKTSMVETIKAAAAKMGCDLFTASGAAAWGGHALRRGGAQYLAASGIDVWRIQALARHSSSAILTYLDGIHAKHLGNIAAEAELGRSLQGLREELRLLQAGVSSEHAKVRVSAMIAPPPGALAIAADLEEVLPPASDATTTTPPGQFVRAFGPGAKVHAKHPAHPKRTWCKWHWTRQSKATVHQEAPAGKMCIRCTEAQLKNSSLSSSDSSGDSGSS